MDLPSCRREIEPHYACVMHTTFTWIVSVLEDSHCSVMYVYFAGMKGKIHGRRGTRKSPQYPKLSLEET